MNLLFSILIIFPCNLIQLHKCDTTTVLNPTFHQTNDHYHNDADESKINVDRSKRYLYQNHGESGTLSGPLIFATNSHQMNNKNGNSNGIVTTSNVIHCITTKGLIGKCTTFRECYPYFKVPELNNYEGWVFGMYDRCTYFTPQGQQTFGVCCTNPIKDNTPFIYPQPSPIPIIEQQQIHLVNFSQPPSIIINNKYPQITNWPPPVPTHPPNHTIPPLPTYPTQISSSTSSIIHSSTSWRPSTVISSTTLPPSTTIISGPVNSCGAKNGYQDQERIVGGHNADVGEWPWIAALFNAGRQFCGGSLIDSTHILSAAHCVAHMSSWDVARITVRLGDYNIKTTSEVRHIEKRVKRIVRHRGFDSRTLYNDIAILILDSPVHFTQQIRPICLPNSASDYSGYTGTVIGWGSLRESGPQPSILQEVNIPIWNNRDCRAKYGSAAPGGIVEHMLCAGQAAKDSCSGDSGGPLMINAGKWTQVGIVSWGIGCGKGQYPGVYTRVEKFLPWITKNLK